MSRIAVRIALVLALMPAAALAQDEAAATTDDAAPPRPLPAERLEVTGTCSTPRQVWLQHLYWSARDHFDRAAACFDTAGIDAAKAAELAERLFDHLNANALYIDTANRDSANPDYTDPTTGKALYADPVASAFVIQKYPDGKWRFPSEALAEIPAFSIGKRIARMLPAWFRNRFIGVPVWSYLGVLLLFFVALATRRVTVFVINRYVARWARRAELPYFERIADQIDRPMAGMSMAVVFYLGFPLLSFPVRASAVMLVAVKALAAFSLVWLGYRMIDVVGAWLGTRAEGTSSKLDDQLVPLVTKTLKVVVSVLGGIFVLQNLDVDVSSLLAGVGLGGLAFALAAKDTVANFFGSIMIFVDKPFQIGDGVTIGDVSGTVVEVGFRTTRIRTYYDSQITVPNSMIASTTVDNIGARQYRRYRTTLGLTYDTPPEKVQAFCEGVRAIIARLDGMRKDSYVVEFTDFGASALEVLLNCFMDVPDYNAEVRTRTKLNLEIMRLAAELGVDFAFPTQTLHIDSVATPSQRAARPGPSSPEELTGVVESFGPGGELGRAGFELSRGFDPGGNWSTDPENKAS